MWRYAVFVDEKAELLRWKLAQIGFWIQHNLNQNVWNVLHKLISQFWNLYWSTMAQKSQNNFEKQPI